MKKLILILLLVFILVSCGKKEKGANDLNRSDLVDRRKPLSWGRPRKIYVFADDQVWKYAQEHLNQAIERTFYTTMNEKLFELERIKYGELENYFRFNNLIFFCDASSSQPVSEYVKEILGENIEQEVSANGAAMFPAFNHWADDQMVLFLVGEDEKTLLKLNILQGDRIYDLFKDRLYKRLEYKIYRGRQKPDSNFKDKIWTLALPVDFMLYKEDEQANFTSYLSRREDNPDRYIAVYYEDMGKDELSRKWLVEKRNELGSRYYEGDRFAETDVMSAEVKIAGYEGIKLMGRWQNDQYAMGGAFSCFAFYLPEQGKVFLIDNSVYYPAGDKLPALIELEIISGTFRLKNEIGN
jgi:hypothetical protein